MELANTNPATSSFSLSTIALTSSTLAKLYSALDIRAPR